MSQIIPKEPDDIELKNIIDKLANFVARNGPEFEQITKEKQKDNPKFQFLFGGEYNDYYLFKVKNENNKNKVSIGANVPPPPPSLCLNIPPPPPPQELLASQISLLQKQIQQLQEQVLQSEKNLHAQREVMKIQRKIRIEEMLRQLKSDKLKRLSTECQIDMNEFERLTNNIIEACTKDAISTGKNFVLINNKSDKHAELICFYILMRINNKDASNDARLHLIYLLNDILHSCNKRSILNLKDNIEKIIIGAYCFAYERNDDEKRIKLSKLVELWFKNKYFSQDTFDILKNPLIGLKYYQDLDYKEFYYSIQSIDTECDDKIKRLERQHNEYVEHVNGQSNGLQKQIQVLQNLPIPPLLSSTQSSCLPPFIPNIPPPNLLHQTQQQSSITTQINPMITNITAKPPPALMSLSSHLDLSKPPPGFISQHSVSIKQEKEFMYYNLPAGLMIPLIKVNNIILIINN